MCRCSTAQQGARVCVCVLEEDKCVPLLSCPCPAGWAPSVCAKATVFPLHFYPHRLCRSAAAPPSATTTPATARRSTRASSRTDMAGASSRLPTR